MGKKTSKKISKLEGKLDIAKRAKEAEISQARIKLYQSAKQYVNQYEACNGEINSGLIIDERDLEYSAAELTRAIDG